MAETPASTESLAVNRLQFREAWSGGRTSEMLCDGAVRNKAPRAI
jgi:hypothetical protein